VTERAKLCKIGAVRSYLCYFFVLYFQIKVTFSRKKRESYSQKYILSPIPKSYLIMSTITPAFTEEKQWRVIYTRSRAEKKLALELSDSGIEHYLPIKKTLKQWSDRKKWVDNPFFTSYVFVKVNNKDQHLAIACNSACLYLRTGNKASIMPQRQMEQLQLLVAEYNENIVLSHDKIAPGDKVIVNCGPFKGQEAEIVKLKGKNFFILRVDCLNCSALVEIGKDDLKKM